MLVVNNYNEIQAAPINKNTKLSVNLAKKEKAIQEAIMIAQNEGVNDFPQPEEQGAIPPPPEVGGSGDIEAESAESSGGS